jgi:hypothetical protein
MPFGKAVVVNANLRDQLQHAHFLSRSNTTAVRARTQKAMMESRELMARADRLIDSGPLPPVPSARLMSLPVRFET